MNKINETGMKLIEFKNEFSKDYPDIVRDSLVLSLQKMIESGEIDKDTLNFVTNNNNNKKMFMEYLVARKEYLKSPEEMKKEYEIYRKKLEELIEMYQINDLETEIAVEKDAILAVRTFSIDGEFVMDYFGVREKDLMKLMKKGGFVEVFVSLRLARVLSLIIDDCSPGMSHIQMKNSLPYVSENGDGYNIDLLMEINVDDFTKTEWRDRILGEVKEVTERAGTAFFQKMII